MKKYFTTLLVAGAFAMTACTGTTYSASSSQSKLNNKGYSAQVLSVDEAKEVIKGLNYNIVKFNNAVTAEKGSGDDYDLFIAFYFSSINDASKFYDSNNHENMSLMHDYGQNKLGANLKLKVGTHNNVAYVGSETSFSNAF